MVRAKGLVFRSFVTALKRQRGDEAYARVLDQLPGDVGEALRVGAIVTGSWYPIGWYADLLEATLRTCEGGHELTRVLAREGVKDDFRSGVHRLVTLALTPEWLIRSSPRIVGLYYDAGRMVVEEAVPGHAMARFEGFHGFTRNIWENVLGGSIGVMELAGAKSVTSRLHSGGGDADAHMTFSLRWH